jgi:hypothetical protein
MKLKAKAMLILIGALAVILAISNIWVYTSLNGELNSLNTTYQQYIDTHTYNNTQYDALVDIINLDKAEVRINNQTITQPAKSYTSWPQSVQYAGYISVNVKASTATNTYVQVLYTAYGVVFDEELLVGTSGIATFPVLPSNVQVRVGNRNAVGDVTVTVTITYTY